MIANYIPSEWKEDVYFNLIFDDGYYNGFSFPCNEKGEPDLNPASRENYEFCLAHPEKFVRFNKVIKEKHRYKKHAQGTCGCGEEVILYDEYMGACSCPKCGQWYNLFGQALISPEFWEENY